MKDYPEKLNDIVDTLSSLPDNERIEMLIDYAESFKEVPAEIASKPYPEESKVPFCESGAYVWSRQNKKGELEFYFAVENPQGLSAKALSYILQKTLTGEDPAKIANVEDNIVLKIFGQGLSMGKNMGLTGILQKVQREAKKYI
jgi:cysteine desulfuration protein SufE